MSHFSQVNFYSQLIHFSHYLVRTQKHALKHSCSVLALYVCFVCFNFFLTTNSEKSNFNFLKKVQLPLEGETRIRSEIYAGLKFQSAVNLFFVHM